jgi:glyoxylase-like metal-dependent hydrolase (beta-lactamase superfamily II)
MQFVYGQPDPIAPGIVRIVANNPSVFTFKGTNTYLVGTSELAVIDPGPDDESLRAAILACAAGRAITHIFVTHAHRDHVDGASPLAAVTGAKVYGIGRRDDGRAHDDPQPAGNEFIDYGFAPDVILTDGQIIEGRDWSLEALFTPGHAPDHLCFAMAQQKTVFSGDHVMAWNTTVIAPPEGRMTDYIGSLEKLLKRRDRLYLPGHGGRIETPQRTVKAYLVHRQWREQAILQAIRDGAADIPAIVARVYSTLDDKLLKAAALSVLAHVESLAERRLVVCELPVTLDRHLSAA